MITEEQRLKVVLWTNPDLIEKDCGLCNGDGAMPRRASWYEPIPGMLARRNFTKELEPLYVWDKNRNWVPNYQFFMDECVSQLKAERVTVRFGFADDGWWYIDPTGGDSAYGDPDPYAALVEMLEAMEQHEPTEQEAMGYTHEQEFGEEA